VEVGAAVERAEAAGAGGGHDGRMTHLHRAVICSRVYGVEKGRIPRATAPSAAPASTATREGQSEQALNRHWSMTYLQGQCTYRRAKEEEEIHSRWR